MSQVLGELRPGTAGSHLGLPSEAPKVAPARPPPQARLPW